MLFHSIENAIRSKFYMATLLPKCNFVSKIEEGLNLKILQVKHELQKTWKAWRCSEHSDHSAVISL